VFGKGGIDCSRKPIGGTLDDRVEQKVAWETGFDVPGTKDRVEFTYRLANRQ
jgi:hypothetical protein